jgi:hypothetical protein
MRFFLFEEERRFRLSSGISSDWGNGGQPVMLDLQREQFDHDERFHREIARLNIEARLKQWRSTFVSTLAGSQQ